MKITDVRAWVIAPYRSAHALPAPAGGEDWARQWEFVALRVFTDEGLEGNAFVWGATGALPAAQLIVQAIKPELVGQDPLEGERLWHRVRRAGRRRGSNPPPAGAPPKDAAICRAVRAAVGPDFPLMVDLHASYTRQEALAVGGAANEIGFAWFE